MSVPRDHSVHRAGTLDGTSSRAEGRILGKRFVCLTTRHLIARRGLVLLILTIGFVGSGNLALSWDAPILVATTLAVVVRLVHGRTILTTLIALAPVVLELSTALALVRIRACATELVVLGYGSRHLLGESRHASH
jgi:hypothetical protein